MITKLLKTRAKTDTLRDRLFQASYDFNEAFSLQLAHDAPIDAQTVLRIVPKRRMVVAGIWQGRAVVAKLFFDKRDAKKHYEKELRGASILTNHNIPTPTIYCHGNSSIRGIYVIVYERLLDAQTLTMDAADLERVTLELATQHVLGITQKDLHKNNFLLNQQQVYTLDGATVTSQSQVLDKKSSMDNLALFFSQLGVGREALKRHLFSIYVRARAWIEKPQDYPNLQARALAFDVQRWARYEKKLFRTSSQFVAFNRLTMRGVYDRQQVPDEAVPIALNPELAFNHPSARLLKNGRSATVVQIQLGEQMWIVKRYNLKNLWHRLRRLWRTTRAANAWRIAHKLSLFQVATATPIAYAERYCLSFRGRAYAITRYVSDQTIGAYFKQHAFDEAKIDTMIARVQHLIHALHLCGLTHGDLKQSNLLINNEEMPVLIDLDGVRDHLSHRSFHAHAARDLRRFFNNFKDQPKLFSRMQAAFQASAIIV